MLHRIFLSVLCLVLVSAPLSAQITSTLSAETGNNTSAAGPYNSTTGNASPGNVSKLPLRSLLYPGATTKIYTHLQPWFCLISTSTTCNGHIQVGYDSNSATQVKRQIDDMISRSANGVISNWYGPYKTIENETTTKIMLDAQSRSPLFEFAIMADQGALNACRDGGYTQCDCWPAGSTNCTVTTHLISALNYANGTFYSSPAYMRRGGRPVVFFFIDESNAPPTGYAGLIDWNWVRANVREIRSSSSATTAASRTRRATARSPGSAPTTSRCRSAI